MSPWIALAVVVNLASAIFLWSEARAYRDLMHQYQHYLAWLEARVAAKDRERP